MTAPQRLTDRKREAIIQAAIAEFRANGFEITSMDKIAATAGVSKRTVYNHFLAKRSCSPKFSTSCGHESAQSNPSSITAISPCASN